MKPGRLISAAPALILALAIPPVLLADTILDDFQVNVEPPGHPPQNSPYSAADWETETIYTTWLSQRDGINWDVGLQLFDYDLQTIDEVQYLNVREGFYNCRQPRLVVGTSGVGAAWIEERQPNRILFRSLDAWGNSISPPVRVEDDFAIVARDSLSMAALDSGYILVWYDERDSSAIWAQIVDLGGNLIGANFPIRPDSTGDVLGLEAQNHPDGRVLVSWVCNAENNRGRWLDSNGNFLGNVFDMTDPVEDVVNSMVRFNTGGNGLLYQYTGPWVFGEVFITYLDSIGMQMGPPTFLRYWGWEDMMPPSSWNDTFPELIFLPYSNYIEIYLRWHGDYSGCYYTNTLLSTAAGLFVHPEPPTGDYQLCLLDTQAFLYSFSSGDVEQQKYEIITLDTIGSLTWIDEPNFGMKQSVSKICVNQEGSFRVTYNRNEEPYAQIYTRYFAPDGTPYAPDTLVSMDENLNPVYTWIADMATTASDQVLVVWRYAGSVLGTLFTGNSWSGAVENFNCSPEVNYWSISLDINNSDHVMLMWSNKWYNPEWYLWTHQEYIKPYESIFNYFYPPVGLGTVPCGEGAVLWDISLRNDGRFLICYLTLPDRAVIFKAGINYQEITTTSSCGFFSCHYSGPVVEKSASGYWITWVADQEWPGPSDCRVYLWQIDSDGNPIGDPFTIDEEEANPVASYIVIAVSQTGNFAIVWQDARMDEGDIFCRQFNPDGSTFGWEYRVNSDPVGPLQKEPAVAFGPEDRLYFTWTDFRNEGGQGDIYCKVIEWNDALSVEEEPVPIPYEFALYPPSPNPFNATTQIRYSLPHDGQTSLTVHNLLGQTVTKLTEGFMKAGNNQVVFDGSGLASGVYIVRLEAEERTATQKLVLMK